MNVSINYRLVRLALGCIQPADADSVCRFVSEALGDGGEFSTAEVQGLFEHWLTSGEVVRVHKRLQLFSLSRLGDGKLSTKERRLRDRTRLFLLKNLRSARLFLPEAGDTEKADDPSAVIVGSAIQEDERPKGAADSPRMARRVGRAFWPLLSKQLFVGSSSRASGPFFRFLSFPSIKACSLANGLANELPSGIGLGEISLALGISPKLIGMFLHKPERHYRAFEIPKANGKVRHIQAPRTMMKVLQYFLLDYVLYRLPVHQAATAYSVGCSNRANAEQHVGKRFVANLDVIDFFPSLKQSVVFRELCVNGLARETATLITRITSFEGGLPQGAPTSAALSNIVLYRFDTDLAEFCRTRGLSYTRYADDMTFSGNEREEIASAIQHAQELLRKFGLALNEKKTRVFGPSSRKVVTGVVVNEWAQPSRVDRRKLRADLHKAKLRPDAYEDEINRLRGRVAYMLSFSHQDRSVGALPHKYVSAALTSLTQHLQSKMISDNT